MQGIGAAETGEGALCHPHRERCPTRSWGEDGGDRIAFEVATNPGAEPGPIQRIASGGELARFMLALKVSLSRGAAGADPGLRRGRCRYRRCDGSRRWREAEAPRRSKLQVLVITHSPQVAALVPSIGGSRRKSIEGRHQRPLSRRLPSRAAPRGNRAHAVRRHDQRRSAGGGR